MVDNKNNNLKFIANYLINKAKNRYESTGNVSPFGAVMFHLNEIKDINPDWKLKSNQEIDTFSTLKAEMERECKARLPLAVATFAAMGFESSSNTKIISFGVVVEDCNANCQMYIIDCKSTTKKKYFFWGKIERLIEYEPMKIIKTKPFYFE